MLLLGVDEYPFHQTVNTFAAVAGTDPSWADGHYICVADSEGKLALTSNVRLYSNNDVLDGFVCLRYNDRQYNVRVSRRLRPEIEHLGAGPLRMEIIEPLNTIRLLLDDNTVGISLDLTCQTTAAPYMGPIEIRQHEGRQLSQRATYEVTGTAAGWVQIEGERIELNHATTGLFRNHSWGFQPPRGRPTNFGAPTPSKRAPGVRQWGLFHMPDHGGFFFEDPSGRAAAGRGAILTPAEIIPVVRFESDLTFYEGGQRLRSGSFSLTTVDGDQRDYEFESLGWVYCQGGGYFGGFDDGLGQGVYRGDEHFEGEVWDVSHPTDVVSADGTTRRFEHDWAESFTVLRSGDAIGVAHHECVVIAESPADLLE